MKITRILFNWKEASTVILFAKHSHSHDSVRAQNQDMMSKKTDGLVSDGVTSTVRDYKILTLERTAKSKFMPSAFVFPGGGISKVDYSDEWLKLYENCAVTDLNSTLPKPMQDQALRAPMFTKCRDWPINSNVAFRICSIRETFEEAGILLCKHCDDVLHGGNINKAWKALDKSTLQEWRPAVREDDTKFLEMCKELSIVPDIWSLHEWSCWLTPTHMDKMHHGRRYDTAFYTCALPKYIDAVHDHEEIVRAKWIDPGELLSEHADEKLWLAPPQIYELRRLCSFDNYDDLKQFSVEREQHGCVRWLPVRMTFQDGIMPILPGDDLYPSDVDLQGTRSIPKYPQSLAESISAAKKLHRFDIPSFTKCKLHCNVPQENNHAAPKPLEDILGNNF